MLDAPLVPDPLQSGSSTAKPRENMSCSSEFGGIYPHMLAGRTPFAHPRPDLGRRARRDARARVVSRLASRRDLSSARELDQRRALHSRVYGDEAPTDASAANASSIAPSPTLTELRKCCGSGRERSARGRSDRDSVCAEGVPPHFP